jgi:hypothetical protein
MSQTTINKNIGYVSFIFIPIIIVLSFTTNNLSSNKELLAQSDTTDNNLQSNNNNNITISSSNNQTNNVGQQDKGNFSATAENRTGSQSLPVLSEISDKGNYRVELRWGTPLDIQSPAILSKEGFDMEVSFLNATAAEATPQTIPGGQTNLTDEPSGIIRENTNLSTIQRTTPVDSFDMAIYDNKGNELWRKDDQTVAAGKASLRILLDTAYSGGVTITINDIKGIPTSGAEKQSPDAVHFTAKLASG